MCLHWRTKGIRSQPDERGVQNNIAENLLQDTAPAE
jgi:hypothetical protein